MLFKNKRINGFFSLKNGRKCSLRPAHVFILKGKGELSAGHVTPFTMPQHFKIAYREHRTKFRVYSLEIFLALNYHNMSFNHFTDKKLYSITITSSALTSTFLAFVSMM